MNHPADWGIGPHSEITNAHFVIAQDDEGAWEVLKDLEMPAAMRNKVPGIRIIFIDAEGNRHIYVGNRVNRE